MRLLNRHRDKIAEALVARKFDPLEKIEKERQKNLAKRIYRSNVSEEIEKKADELSALCPGIVYMDYDVYVAPKGSRALRMHFGFNLPMPGGCMNVKPDENSEFYEEAVDIINRHYALQDERYLAKTTASAALSKFYDIKKLEAAWPDVMPIVREVLGDDVAPVVNLPAISTVDLNAMFDLPTDPAEMKEAA